MPAIRRLACALLLLAAPAVGAEVPGHPTIDLPALLDLPGDLVHVRYTPGTLDRAAHAQYRFEAAAKEFTRTGYQATALLLYVLSPEDWKAAGLGVTFGLPARLGLEAMAVPAWADGELIGKFSAWLGGDVPLPAGHPLLATPAEAGALAVSDLLAQLELSRIYVARAGLAGDRPWIAPLAAHLVARLAWDRVEPGRMPEIAAVFDRLAAADRTPGGHGLAEWREDLPLATRSWFDTRFLRGADQIVVARGPIASLRILKKAVSGRAPLSEQLLLKEVPELAGWLATSFKPQ